MRFAFDRQIMVLTAFCITLTVSNAPAQTVDQSCLSATALQALQDEDAICGKVLDGQKRCDAAHRPASPPWQACYDKNRACRKTVSDANAKARANNVIFNRCEAARARNRGAGTSVVPGASSAQSPTLNARGKPGTGNDKNSSKPGEVKASSTRRQNGAFKEIDGNGPVSDDVPASVRPAKGANVAKPPSQISANGHTSQCGYSLQHPQARIYYSPRAELERSLRTWSKNIVAQCNEGGTDFIVIDNAPGLRNIFAYTDDHLRLNAESLASCKKRAGTC